MKTVLWVSIGLLSFFLGIALAYCDNEAMPKAAQVDYLSLAFQLIGGISGIYGVAVAALPPEWAKKINFIGSALSWLENLRGVFVGRKKI